MHRVTCHPVAKGPVSRPRSALHCIPLPCTSSTTTRPDHSLANAGQGCLSLALPGSKLATSTGPPISSDSAATVAWLLPPLLASPSTSPARRSTSGSRSGTPSARDGSDAGRSGKSGRRLFGVAHTVSLLRFRRGVVFGELSKGPGGGPGGRLIQQLRRHLPRLLRRLEHALANRHHLLLANAKCGSSSMTA